ncbi:MAG TPA: AlkA N-terminal domain-containing protein [Gemmatimonadaceae bacterium]|nr:AlkA N-terminal domain-containing protein [Gemmatimonadaceae bacterium]
MTRERHPLPFEPPLDWPALLGYLAARATPGVEAVSLEHGWYRRAVALDGHAGIVRLQLDAQASVVRVEMDDALAPVRAPLLARLRALLDLDADVAAIAGHLGADPRLAPLVARRPGLRVPGGIDGFEVALRTVLGQQVSVRGATTLAGRLVLAVAEPLPEALVDDAITHRPVTAARLADVDVDRVAAIGLPRSRAACVDVLARAVADGTLPELVSMTTTDPDESMRRLRALPGIGFWTATYVAMRALRWPDAFPEGDLALRKAMGGLTPTRLLDAAERWRPWRAYAAQHLWSGAAGG